MSLDENLDTKGKQQGPTPSPKSYFDPGYGVGLPRVPKKLVHVVELPHEVAIKGEALSKEKVQEIQEACEKGYVELRQIFGLAPDPDFAHVSLEADRERYALDNESRCGAEVELVLADKATGRPVNRGADVLGRVATDSNLQKRITPELANHNLELNFTPLSFERDTLSKLDAEYRTLLGTLNSELEKEGAVAVACGILPSFQPNDMTLQSLFPGKDRYHDLSVSLQEHRGGDFSFTLRGKDEDVDIKSYSIMAESLNTSLQLHFQVPLEQYTEYHAISELITGPLLAVSANSPLVFGYRGPKESRPDVWAGSIAPERVPISGLDWLTDPLEQLKESVYEKALLSGGEGATPIEELTAQSKTRYPWNRTTLHIDEEKKEASIRVENRIAPAQPTPKDTVAVAAFYYGLMEGLKAELEEKKVTLPEVMNHDEVIDNFTEAKHYGMSATVSWYDGKVYHANELIRDKLVPLAEKGLRRLGVDDEVAASYLRVIQGRAELGVCPSDVLLVKDVQLEEQGLSREERGKELTKWYIERAAEGKPVHTWLSDISK